MKKIIFYSLIIIIFLGFFSNKTFAQTQTPPSPCISPQIMVNGTCTTPVGSCTGSDGSINQEVTQASCSGVWVGDYYFLAPLPNQTNNGNGKLNTSFNPSDPNALGTYLN